MNYPQAVIVKVNTQINTKEQLDCQRGELTPARPMSFNISRYRVPPISLPLMVAPRYSPSCRSIRIHKPVLCNGADCRLAYDLYIVVRQEKDMIRCEVHMNVSFVKQLFCGNDTLPQDTGDPRQVSPVGFQIIERGVITQQFPP